MQVTEKKDAKIQGVTDGADGSTQLWLESVNAGLTPTTRHRIIARVGIK